MWGGLRCVEIGRGKCRINRQRNCPGYGGTALVLCSGQTHPELSRAVLTRSCTARKKTKTPLVHGPGQGEQRVRVNCETQANYSRFLVSPPLSCPAVDQNSSHALRLLPRGRVWIERKGRERERDRIANSNCLQVEVCGVCRV